MKRKLKLAALAAVFFLGITGVGIVHAADNDTDKSKKVQAGYEETKDLLRLMDKDKNGKVSKKEFMDFMNAEFDLLDQDKNGELDVNELSHIQVGKHPGGTGR
jgi:EF hand domain-containing protein